MSPSPSRSPLFALTGRRTVYIRIHLNSQGLWGDLIGEHLCPPRPTPLVLPALPAGANQAAQEAAIAALEEALELYQSKLHSYERWQDAEACDTTILVGSMPMAISMDVAKLPTT